MHGIWGCWMECGNSTLSTHLNYHQKDTFMLQGIVGYNTRLISAVLPKEILAQTKDWDTRLAYLLQLQNGLPV